ncbi:pyridoxal phosphate-dependent decarboxylase family protein [Motilimonas pumila]|uniref:pyridoxal phosphate-dependent decarboxylase family protein n=1 Tax=Motilimonas pumila TaxID=2303987 RepID=UPI001313F166|nr:aspartate aminotransferase family protein [Motilimonas pumila]
MSPWQQHFIATGPGGSEHYQDAMAQTVAQLAHVFEQADKPYSGLDPVALKQQIEAINLSAAPHSLQQVIQHSAELIAHHSILVQHPACIAHLHTPPMIAGIAAESMIAALNQSMDSWDQASAATYVEQHVVDWLCQTFGYDQHSDGVFTSGGTQSNIMALLMARDWAVDSISQHNVQQQGMPEYSHRLRIVCSDKSHFTVKKAASIMGLGEKAVVCVPTHNNGTIKIDALNQCLNDLKQAELIPFALVGTAGTTDHGAIDDLSALAELAKQHKLWFHVDAAYGGALILSQQNQRLAGIHLADSITVDFHKLWYQPVSCSALLLKHKAHFKYLLHYADYLNREGDYLPNLVDKTISTTRRFDALKVLMTLRTVGKEALGAMIDHLITQTRQVAQLIDEHQNFELLAQPSLSTVLFRYQHPVDAFNRQLRLACLKAGVAVLGETTVNGQAALKLTILNPCLSIENFTNLLTNINEFADSLLQMETC